MTSINPSLFARGVRWPMACAMSLVLLACEDSITVEHRSDSSSDSLDQVLELPRDTDPHDDLENLELTQDMPSENGDVESDEPSDDRDIQDEICADCDVPLDDSSQIDVGCREESLACTDDGDCCSGHCRADQSCAPKDCTPFWQLCSEHSNCCSGVCDPYISKCVSCILSDGSYPCTDDYECCGICFNGYCSEYIGEIGAECYHDGHCWQMNCDTTWIEEGRGEYGICVFCRESGSVCPGDSWCCSGVCENETPEQQGTCL